jgi:Uma2 family endonuclease
MLPPTQGRRSGRARRVALSPNGFFKVRLDGRLRARMLSEMAVAYERKNRPLTRAEYEELVRRGVLEDAQVELLYGRIVSMSPIGGQHVYSVTRLSKLFVRALGDRADVHVQAPFAAPDESEPQPDVSVVLPGDYLERPPDKAWLVVEVADSSLERDRAKAALYAAAGATEYWIVNIRDATIEVHREPGPTSYARVTYHRRGEGLKLVAFPDIEIRVADVLPPA